LGRILVWYVVGNWIAQWKNDISIWENKVWQLKPILVKEDGPVQKLRRYAPPLSRTVGTPFLTPLKHPNAYRWYAQFYSSKSAVEKNTLEW
jgi:hypothetical protein